MLGIPVTKLKLGELERLLQREENLHHRVIGLHDAVIAVANAVRRSPFSPADAQALRAVLADPAAGDAERAAATAAIAVTDGAHHDEREVEGLARESGLPVAVLPHVPDLAPGSGGLEALSAALMGDPAIRGAA